MTLKITHADNEWCPKYYAPIVGIFCALYMITGALVPKLIDIYGFILPAAIITFPLCCIITDLLTEVYGFNRTRQAVWTVLVCNILFAIFMTIGTQLPAASLWPHNDAFKAIYAMAPRIAAAGCLAWLAGEFVNSYIVSKMKIAQQSKNMPVRFVVSTIFGQFIDSAVFFTVAFVGVMPVKEVIGLILTTWLFKLGYEILALPLSVPITRKVKQWEGVEHFDDRQKISVI